MKNKKCFILSALITPMIFVASVSVADIAIIVNPKMEIVQVTSKQVAKVYLGKESRIDGVFVDPIDQDDGETIRGEFYTGVINKTESQLNSYWSRLIFTGKGMPPDRAANDDEVLDIVSDEPSRIGYVDVGSVDERVKVILVIQKPGTELPR